MTSRKSSCERGEGRSSSLREAETLRQSLLDRAGAYALSVTRNLCRARVDTTCRQLAVRWRLSTVISKVRGANHNFSSRMWVVAEAWERLLLLSPSPPVRGSAQSASDGSVARSALLRVEAYKILSAAAAFRLSEAGLGRGARMCVRVICTCVRIVSGRPLRAVALSCWRRTSTWRAHTVNADDGSHCALVSQRFFCIFL